MPEQGWVRLIEKLVVCWKRLLVEGSLPGGNFEWVEKNEQKYKNGTGFLISALKVTDELCRYPLPASIFSSCQKSFFFFFFLSKILSPSCLVMCQSHIMYSFLLLYVKHTRSKFRSHRHWSTGTGLRKPFVYSLQQCLKSTWPQMQRGYEHRSLSSINFPALVGMILISWVVLLLVWKF